MYTILVNPISGNGKAIRAIEEIQKIMREYGCEARLEQTTEPGDATRIAREAVARGDEGIVIVGGDGTIFETLNGMVGSELTLIYAPCGTGNDFVKCMGLPIKFAAALRRQLAASRRKIDYGTVNETPFMNVCGTGFDVEVLRKLAGYRARFQGLKAYLMALKDALREYRPFHCEISVDGGAFIKKTLCILSIGNGNFFGGGMKAVPSANPCDGLLDLVEVKAIKKWLIPFLLPLFISGKHTLLRVTSSQKCKRVCIRAKNMIFQMDGEMRKMDEADIRVVPEGVWAQY